MDEIKYQKNGEIEEFVVTNTVVNTYKKEFYLSLLQDKLSFLLQQKNDIQNRIDDVQKDIDAANLVIPK